MFSWQFTTHKDRPKSWYLIALVVVLFLVIYGIYEWLYLMSVVSFLFAGVYIMMENNTNPITSVLVDEQKIKVNSSVYELSKISRFAYLSDNEKVMMLRIFPKKSIATIIDIPLTEEVDTVALREFLETKIEFDADVDWGKSDRIIHAMRL